MTIRGTLSALGLAAALCLALLDPAMGMDKEFYVNTYRSIGVSPVQGQRAAAMGRTGAGIADGVASINNNPAGLGAFTGYGMDVGLGYDWLDDGITSTDQVSFRLGGAVSLEKWRPSGASNQTVGAQLYTQSYSGAGGVSMERAQAGFALGYGIHLMQDLVAGASAALYDGDWSAQGSPTPFDRGFTGGEFKVGGLYRFSDEFTGGIVGGYSVGSYNDKGAYAQNNGSGNLNRWNLKAGVGYQFCDTTLLAGDIWYDNMSTKVGGKGGHGSIQGVPAIEERNRAWGVSAGVEQQVLPDVLALRGGMYYDRTSYSSAGSAGRAMFLDGTSDFGKSRFGFTAGAAVKLFSFDIGYSLDVNTKGDINNLFDLSTEW